MSRKTKKLRIGPVPITLVAVLALAAFLSVGLLLVPNGAPTAEAQDADCTVNLDADGTVTDTGTIDCKSPGGSVLIAFKGPETVVADDAPKMQLLIQDSSGQIRAYPNGYVDYDAIANRYQITADGAAGGLGEDDAVAPAPMRFKYMELEVPQRKRNLSTLEWESGSTNLTAKGDVYIYAATVTDPLTEVISTGAPEGDRRRQLAEIAADSTMVDVTLLGVPKLGVDGSDYNEKVDDDEMLQCVESGNEASTDPTKVVGEVVTGGDCDTDSPVDSTWASSTAITDAMESRSKLVAHTAEVTGDGAATAMTTPLITGKSAEHTLMGGQKSATIYAVIEDAQGRALENVEVTFMVTSEPQNIALSTRTVDSAKLAADPTVSGITHDGDLTDGDDRDAIAMREIGGLPTSNSGYRVSVKVMAGTLNLGTMVIARAGALGTVSAEACEKVMTGKTDISDDGCMSTYNPEMIYGRSTDDDPSTFSIYAKATDSLGSMVTPDTFMVKPVTMEGYGDATKAFDITADGKNLEDRMAMFTVKKDAPHGKYLLDVIATEGTGPKMITKTDQVMIIVSGPLAMYGIEGPDRIQPGQVVTYTVHAQDELGNPADYGADQEKMADVFVDAIPSTIPVRLLDLDDGTTLNLEEGSKDSFRLRVPPGSGHGSLTITVSDKNKDVVDAFKDVRIGANRAPMAGAAMADQMLTVGGMVEVQSTITDPDSDMLTWLAMSNDEMVATAMVDDMGMVTITAAGAGMATITVTATDPSDRSVMQEIMVTVEEVNVAPMAGEAIDPVMMTMGDDPMMVATMFTDANADDMLSYSVMSSDEMVATAMVDDMGEVTITAMGAGTATVTVTATDSDGLSAMQDIMVTVTAQMLGTPSVSSAMSDSAGMATISIMPAANADSHYIWALPTDYSSNADGMFSGEAAGDATSITMSRLTSGKSYWFTVVAGMDMDDGPTEWAWATGWTGATAIR